MVVYLTLYNPIKCTWEFPQSDFPFCLFVLFCFAFFPYKYKELPVKWIGEEKYIYKNWRRNFFVELNIRYYSILIFSDKIFHCYPAEVHFVLLVSKTVKMRMKTTTFGK